MRLIVLLITFLNNWLATQIWCIFFKLLSGYIYTWMMFIYIHKHHPCMCLVLWNCNLYMKKFHMNPSDCVTSWEAPSFGASPRSCSTHTGWTSHTGYALQCGSCGFSAAAEPETSSAARRFPSEVAAYVIYVAEHCRASEKRLLRRATAIKGVWAIGKPQEGRSHVVIEVTSPPAGDAWQNHSRGIWSPCKVTFALSF